MGRALQRAGSIVFLVIGSALLLNGARAAEDACPGSACSGPDSGCPGGGFAGIVDQICALDPTGHCHYEGIPHALYFTFQIFQTPTKIAFVHENMHAWRIVYLTGDHPKDYSAWMGDSRGRWEGNTLVVDVTNNSDKACSIWQATSTAINCASSNDTRFRTQTRSSGKLP